MALPGTFDMTGDDAIYRGDWYGLRLTFTEDIDDRTWRAQIRADQSLSAALLAEAEIDDSEIASRVLTVVFTGPATAAVEALSGWWDLEGTLIADADNVQTKLAGEVEFVGDASRAA